MITVLLADDNLIVREGVRAMLSRQHDIDVMPSPPKRSSPLVLRKSGQWVLAPPAEDASQHPAFADLGVECSLHCPYERMALGTITAVRARLPARLGRH